MLKKLAPFLSFFALFVILAIASPHFLTVNNLFSVVRQTAVITIIAIGMTMIIVSGGIDLSVGSILGLAGVGGTLLMRSGTPIVVSVLAGIILGLLCGGLNALLVTICKVPPFIVTLGTLGAYRGLTLLVTGGMPVVDLPRSFGRLAEDNLFNVVPVPMLILILVALLFWYILTYTRLGRYSYAIGSNREAVLYSGVDVNRYVILIYTLAGALTGLAGMLESSRLITGQPTAGEGYELRVIASVVIGGGSLRGGEGTVIGTIVGSFIMGLLSNGANLLGISPFIQQILIGMVIILAVTFDEFQRRKLQNA